MRIFGPARSLLGFAVYRSPHSLNATLELGGKSLSLTLLDKAAIDRDAVARSARDTLRRRSGPVGLSGEDSREKLVLRP